MDVQKICKPVFARHESFHMRYGWLKKAYDKVQKNPKVFTNERATVELGVGKNMVRAIRFWGFATKTFESSGYGEVRPTWFGNELLAENGHDPYLEDTETLWLLHWMIFSKPCILPSWWFAINEFSLGDIPVEKLKKNVKLRVCEVDEWDTPSMNSVEKDIDVFAHTYVTGRNKHSVEDYLDCPFRQLGLVRRESRTLRFAHGRKDGLSPGVVAYACMDYAINTGMSSRSVPLSRLASEPGSVGAVFKIGEDDIASLLRDASWSDISVDNVGGIQHITFGRLDIGTKSILKQILKSVYMEAVVA